MKEQKNKIARSVSAFAFALTLFAAGSGTNVSASEIDPSVAGASLASSYDEDMDDSDDGQAVEDTNDDNAEDITTTYSQEHHSDEDDAQEFSPAEDIGEDKISEVPVEPSETDIESAPVSGDVSAETGQPSESTDIEDIVPNEVVETVAPDDQTSETSAETVNEDTQVEAEAAATTVKKLLNEADGYNVFIEGDYTQYASGGNVDMGDGKGVVAVGGNMNFNNTVAGSIEVGGSINGSTNSPAVSGEDCSIDFQTAFDNLRQTSSNLTNSFSGVGVNSSDPNNYVKNEYGTVTFKGNNSNLNVFTLTVDEYNALVESESHSLNYDVPEGSTVLINIVGEGDLNLVTNWGCSYAGNQLTSGNSNNANVLVNVPNAINVKIGCSVGALLAPNSHITSNGDVQHYEGQVIGKSFEGSIEFGSTSFNGSLTPDTTDTPDNPDEPDTPDVPEVPDTPDNPDEPDTPDVPEVPDTPDNPDEPDTPDVPEVPDTPDNPDEPDAPDVPEVPDTPDNPDEPDTPDVPEVPDTPDNPDEPDTPDVPEVPDTPDNPDEPDTPDVPEVPDVPNTPDIPNRPDIPFDDPIVPIDDFDLDVVPDAPTEPETAEVDTVDGQSNVPEDETTFETFEEPPMPLSDSPFSDSDSDSDSDSVETTRNPKTGNKNKMVAPAITALGAMSVLIAELSRQKKRREE